MRAYSLSLFLAIPLLFVTASSVLSAPRTDIPAPALISPQNGGTSTIPVTLQWSKVTFPFSLAGGYLLEVAGEGINRSGQNATWALTNSFGIPEQLVSSAGKTYQWRVRACLGVASPEFGKEDSVCGNWGSGSTGFWTFTTALSKPVLLAPENNKLASLQSGPQGPSVKLEWQRVPGFIDGYKVIISNPQFPQPFEFTNRRTAQGAGSSELATFFWIPKELVVVNSEPHSWRVVPVQGAINGFSSDTWQFVISLAKPEPVKPKPDTQALYPLSFEWKGVSGGTMYALGITDAKENIIATDTSQTSYSFIAGARDDFFRLGERYTWQVTPCQTLSLCGPPGGPWPFTLGLAAPTPISPISPAGEKLVLVAPTPTLKWNRPSAPAGPLGYSWEVIKGPTSASGSAKSDKEQVEVKVSSLLNPGNYTWRVKACSQDGNACSNWSTEAVFQVPQPILTISPDSAKILVGGGKQFQASFDSDGSAGPNTPEQKTTEAAWSSENSTIARTGVDFPGVAICQASGNTNIRATFQGFSVQALLTCFIFEKPTITSPTAGQTIAPPFTFQWQKPSNAEENMKYTWKISGFTLPTPISSATQSLQMTQNQLKPGSYTFEIVASLSNDQGASEPSKINFMVGETAGPTIPTTPTSGIPPISGPTQPSQPAVGVGNVVLNPPGHDFHTVLPGQQAEDFEFTVSAVGGTFPIQGNVEISGPGFTCVSGCSYYFTQIGDSQKTTIRFTGPTPISDPFRVVGTVGIANAVADLAGTVSTTGATPRAPGAAVPPREGILGFGDRLANIAFTALLITAIVMVLLAAFQFVTGGGNPEEIIGARNKLIWAVVGIGVALLAKGVPAILQKILLPSGEKPPGPCPDKLIPPSGIQTGIQNPLDTACFAGILDSILNVIFTISLIAVPLVVLYAGFLFATGGGNPQQFIKARNTLIWTGVGFGVILISKGLPFILKDILGF